MILLVVSKSWQCLCSVDTSSCTFNIKQILDLRYKTVVWEGGCSVQALWLKYKPVFMQIVSGFACLYAETSHFKHLSCLRQIPATWLSSHPLARDSWKAVSLLGKGLFNYQLSQDSKTRKQNWATDLIKMSTCCFFFLQFSLLSQEGFINWH